MIVELSRKEIEALRLAIDWAEGEVVDKDTLAQWDALTERFLAILKRDAHDHPDEASPA